MMVDILHLHYCESQTVSKSQKRYVVWLNVKGAACYLPFIICGQISWITCDNATIMTPWWSILCHNFANNIFNLIILKSIFGRPIFLIVTGVMLMTSNQMLPAHCKFGLQGCSWCNHWLQPCQRWHWDWSCWNRISEIYSDLKPNVLTRNCIGSLCSQDLCKWYHTNCALVIHSSQSY